MTHFILYCPFYNEFMATWMTEMLADNLEMF